MINLIIPTYKARDTLPKALDSLVAQTRSMFIVTIVQDCDDEDYTDLIKTYSDRGLHIRHIKTPQNGGPGMARQYGMDSDTQSDYFMFMDADDMLMPRAIEILYHEAKMNNADVISSNFIAESTHGPGQLMEAQNIPCTWTHGKIYRAQYLRENNIRFISELRLNEDSYFNLVACNCTNKKMTLPEVTYLWRDNRESLTRVDSFFERSWTMYIISQVMGILKIIEVTGEISSVLLAMTLNNVYSHTMKARFLELDDSNANFIVSQLKSVPQVQDAINNEKFWLCIADKLRACDIMDKNRFFFYSERFIDWLQTNVLQNNIEEKLDIQ